jgi:serine/threonine protein kinase
MDEKKVIGPYETTEELGRGGMSIVYKADHPTLSKKVAIKLLSPSLSQDPKFIERFKNEAKLLSSFRHQNIVSIIDFGEDNKQYYIVMDFIEGYTIRQMIQQTGPMSLKIALNVMKSVASAISYTHRKGIIHRDLKSSNIMIDHTGRILVTDFGLSKDISLKSIPETTMQSNDIAGTFGYIAPEQLDPKIGNIDERTDIYSLGVVFYEMVTSQLPFSEKNAPINLAYMHLSVVPELPSKLRKDLLPKAEQVIMKMIEKDPLKRYQSFDEIVSAVSEIEDIAKYYRESTGDASGSFFEIVTEDQSFTKSIEEFNKTFESKPIETKPHDDSPLIGKIIQNRYRIEKLLLKRILSNLYLGYDMQQKQPVTIQIPNETRPTFRARLEREIETMKQVDHPNFVQFLDIINEEDTFYVIREYIDGRSVKNLLDSGKIDIDKAVEIVISILDGLIFLHGRSIIHRDINSDVIMITNDLKAKITTLGITRVEDASSVSSGEFLGIVQYTAPEQITQSKSDARSDLYSVGILLFELLTGKPPFSSPLPVDVMDMHLKKIPRFPDQLQNQIPLNLQRIVLKALSKSPDQRYQTAQEFQNELKHFMKNHLSPNSELSDEAYSGEVSSGSRQDQDISSEVYNTILESNKNSPKNLSFSIKKGSSSVAPKKKPKRDMDDMITENIKPKQEKQAVSFDMDNTHEKSKRKPTVLLPLALVLMLAVLGYLFYPQLSGIFTSNSPKTTSTKPALAPIVLAENQSTSFPSFEPYTINFNLNQSVAQVVVEQLPQEVKLLSSSLQDKTFKMELMSELVSIKTPFVARLVGLDASQKQVFSKDFIFTSENKDMIMIQFSLGSTLYKKTTQKGTENLDFEVQPLLHHFNIYLPLRFIIDTFDGQLEYDFPQNMITIKNLGEETYRFFLYQNKYYAGEKLYPVNPILEIEDRAYLPIFLFSEKKGLYTTISPGENGNALISVIKLR